MVAFHVQDSQDHAPRIAKSGECQITPVGRPDWPTLHGLRHGPWRGGLSCFAVDDLQAVCGHAGEMPSAFCRKARRVKNLSRFIDCLGWPLMLDVDCIKLWFAGQRKVERATVLRPAWIFPRSESLRMAAACLVQADLFLPFGAADIGDVVTVTRRPSCGSPRRCQTSGCARRNIEDSQFIAVAVDDTAALGGPARAGAFGQEATAKSLELACHLGVGRRVGRGVPAAAALATHFAGWGGNTLTRR